MDLPSGLPSDGGAVDWPAARATVTVTFAAPKRGHVLPPACDHVGELVVADIGISAESLAAASPSLFLLEDADAAGAFPRRRRGAHKGDFGHVLVVAGSVGKTGAAVLAAGGALRGGCRPRDGGDARAVPAGRGRGARRGDDGAAAGDGRGRARRGRRWSGSSSWPPSATPSCSAPASARTRRRARSCGPSCARARCRW